MSLRGADVRFLLPHAPRRALVSEDLPETRRGLEEAGVMASTERPDVAVVTARGVPAALAAQAPQVIVVGRGAARALRGHMPVLRRLVALPDPITPQALVPVDRDRVASYAIRAWAAAESRSRRLRNRLATACVAIGAFPDLSRSVTVGLASDEAPFMVEAAGAFGVPRDADWFLTLGLGDELARATFQLFARAEKEPAWVLKFARVPGHTTPFDRDERGLELAAKAGGVTAAHAPRLLGRFDAGGLPASVEEAAAGQRLTHVLRAPLRRTEKLGAIDAVAAWIVDMGRETATSPDALAEEHRRLDAQVVAHWRHAGAPADLVARLPEVPAVLQHNDLGCWNVVTGSRGFLAVDWESARRHGLPLWDLLYFLVDALIHLDGEWAPGRREVHAAKLLRGEVPSSAVLMRWVRRGVGSLAIPPAAVGPIATLGWMHHGTSRLARRAAVEALGVGPASSGTYGEWIADVWLREPGLGPGWDAWAR